MALIFRLVSVGLLLSLPLSQPLRARGAIETKQVLVLYSVDSAHPAHKLTDQRGSARPSVRTRCSTSSCMMSTWMLLNSAVPPMPMHLPITCAAFEIVLSVLSVIEAE